MLRTSARRPGTSVTLGVTTGLLLLGSLLAGCSADEKAAAAPEPTPIASLSTTAMAIPRIDFCRLVSGSAVSAALGGAPVEKTAYGNGDQEELPGVGTDVVHEIGCSWTAAEGAEARAWVFARPVDQVFAGTVVASSGKTEGCRTVRGPAYGTPATSERCRLPDGRVRLRHAGLFGQTWLTCELSGGGRDEDDLGERLDRWCVEIATTLDAAR